ncbi:hypothetical protein ABIF39_008866 [Bradyrhizobium diazoefficiens]
MSAVAAVTPVEAARAIVDMNRAYWRMVMQISGWGRAA